MLQIFVAPEKEKYQPPLRRFLNLKIKLICRPKMTWTEEQNIMLYREMLIVETYQYTIVSRKRGHLLDTIERHSCP